MKRIIFVLFIVCLINLAGCSYLTHPATTTTTQTVVSKILFAMNQVKSFTLNTDIINTYKVIEGTTTDTTEWKGTKLIDISSQGMNMNMTIAEVYPGSIINASLEMYFKDGEEYLKTVATGLYQPNPWIKTHLTNTLWRREIQISYLTEILKTATQFSSLEDEKVNNTDCYVLIITPAVQSIIDFVVAQKQPFGSQIDVMWGGGIPVVRPDAYKNGSIKLWIGQDNYLPVKVEINADFQGNIGGGSITTTTIPYTPTTNPVDSNFQGQLFFSNYNQPVSINIPQDALNAK